MANDDARHLARLRVAREQSGKSQAGAARELGLSSASKSTISDWENGKREPALRQLRTLARYYDVPLGLFIDPPATAYEQLGRLKQLALAAIEAAEEDLAEEERGLEGDEPPAGEPRRRSA